MGIKTIKQCRLCGSPKLKNYIDLGTMYFSGVFPKSKDEMVKKGPLALVICQGECGLLQLKHKYEPSELFTDSYGYRSSLNASMIKHLQSIVEEVQKGIKLDDGDIVMDIGSNDGTLLKQYKKGIRYGVEINCKFEKYYNKTSIRFMKEMPTYKVSGEIKEKAKIITSIAMFYDLNDPLAFAESVRDHLTNDGSWITEQSHAPTMIANCAYDTICHEHACYYSEKQMSWIAKKVGLTIVDCSYDDTNGGSFRVTFRKIRAFYSKA